MLGVHPMVGQSLSQLATRRSGVRSATKRAA